MSVYHGSKRGYTTIDNEIFRYRGLSWKAKGIYASIASVSNLAKNDRWNYSVAGLATTVTDSRDATATGIAELERTGFLMRFQLKENGQYTHAHYIYFDEPTTFDEAKEAVSLACAIPLERLSVHVKVLTREFPGMPAKPKVTPVNGKSVIGVSDDANCRPINKEMNKGAEEINEEAGRTDGFDDAFEAFWQEISEMTVNRNSLADAKRELILLRERHDPQQIKRDWDRYQKQRSAVVTHERYMPQLANWLKGYEAQKKADKSDTGIENMKLAVIWSTYKEKDPEGVIDWIYAEELPHAEASRQPALARTLRQRASELTRGHNRLEGTGLARRAAFEKWEEVAALA